jgi:hypothetical protein
MDLNDLIKNPEQIKGLIALLQSLVPEDNQTNKEQPETNVSKMKTKSRGSRNKNKEDTNNKFLSMPEFSMHKEDSKLDKILCNKPPVARSRENSMIDVVCRVCGKKESVSPSLADAPSRYKCNNCSTQAG